MNTHIRCQTPMSSTVVASQTPRLTRGINPRREKFITGHSEFSCAELQEQMDRRIRSELTARTHVHAPDHTRVEVAKWGYLGNLAQQIDIIVYDHPALIDLCSTAFTTGTHVFVSAPFADQMLRGDAASWIADQDSPDKLPSSTTDTVFVMLHELSHIAYSHTQSSRPRLAGYPLGPRQKNIVFDAVINSRLIKSFPEDAPYPAPHLRLGEVGKQGIGTHDPDRFAELSEERAAQLFLEDPDAFFPDDCSAPNQSGEGQPSGSPGKGGTGQGSGAPGQEAGDEGGPAEPGSGAGGDPSSRQSGGEAADGSGSEPGEQPLDADNANDHVVDPRELAERLREHGLHEVADKLGVSEALKPGGESKVRERVEQSITAAAEKTIKDKNTAQSLGMDPNKLPGAHIDQSILEEIRLTLEPKTDFRIALKKLLRAGADRWSPSMSHRHDLTNVDPSAMGLNSSLRIPGLGPSSRSDQVFLFLVDSSGSMDTRRVATVADEIYGFAKSSRRLNPRIRIFSADTTLRNECKHKDSRAIERWLKDSSNFEIAGRGGTDYTQCLNDVIALHRAQPNAGRIAGIFYFGDLGDSVPSRDNLPKNMPPVHFMCDKSDYSVAFDDEVRKNHLGTVIPIEDRRVVNIRDDSVETSVDSGPGM